jgi:hypothetical protein
MYSVFSATLLLSITALFREPKARKDLKLEDRINSNKLSNTTKYTTTSSLISSIYIRSKVYF